MLKENSLNCWKLLIAMIPQSNRKNMLDGLKSSWIGQSAAKHLRTFKVYDESSTTIPFGSRVEQPEAASSDFKYKLNRMKIWSTLIGNYKQFWNVLTISKTIISVATYNEYNVICRRSIRYSIRLVLIKLIELLGPLSPIIGYGNQQPSQINFWKVQRLLCTIK